MRNNKGFSLVELMIVVAIIGILAAIAIPNFITMQLKAKRGELPSNVNGIKTAEVAYDAMYDGFLAASPNPTAPGGKTPQDFDKTMAGWSQLPWAPDGKVRGSYDVSGVTSTDFTVTANADVDGDGAQSQYTATSSINSTQVSANDVF